MPPAARGLSLAHLKIDNYLCEILSVPLGTLTMEPTDVYKRALLADKEGDWEHAHFLIQDLTTPGAAWIHAYLHRKEGDGWNANYWYRRAQKSPYKGGFDEEWQEIWDQLVPSLG